MRPCLPLALVAAALAAPAAAHDFWLQPADFQPAPGAGVALTLQVGHGEQRQRSSLPARRILRFEAEGPSGGRVDLRAALHPGGVAEDAEVRLPRPGTYVLVLQTDAAAQSHLPALRFNDYLVQEGLTPALDARRRARRTGADGSERYARSAKALIQVGGGGGGAAVRPVGLPLEIVPLADPCALPPDAPLPVSVLYEGRPLAGARVTLTDLARDAQPTEVRRTDARGEVIFRPPGPGAWLLNVVWTRPLPGREEVDFETRFSSLSFAIAPPLGVVAGR